MKIIYLVRHAQKVSQAGDPELTALGQEQAYKTGVYLSQFPITDLVASPLKRTTQTASEISKSVQLPLFFDDRLVERMNWDSDTTSYEEFCTEWFKSTHERGYVPMWGDSSYEVGSRISQLVSELDDDTQTILVSHGGAITDYLRNTFGDAVVAGLIKTFEPYGFDYDYGYCGISKVVLDDQDVAQLEVLHFLDHLA